MSHYIALLGLQFTEIFLPLPLTSKIILMYCERFHSCLGKDQGKSGQIQNWYWEGLVLYHFSFIKQQQQQQKLTCL